MLSLGQALPREALQALPVEEVLSACDHNGCSCFHWDAGRCRVCRVILLVFVHFNISSAQVWRSGFLWNHWKMARFSGIIEKWHKSSAILVGSVVLSHLDSFSKIVSASDAGFAVVSFAAGNGHLAACKFLLQLDPGMIFALSSWHVFDPWNCDTLEHVESICVREVLTRDPLWFSFDTWKSFHKMCL